MISESVMTQKSRHYNITNKHKKITIITNSNNRIYYAHPIQTYNTAIESSDLRFLNGKGKLTNPRSLDIGSDMFSYVRIVKDHDCVWFRGNSIGVVLEVLSALAFRKNVYSLETKKAITEQQITVMVEIFNSFYYKDNDIRRFKAMFPEYYSNFKKLTGDEL